MPEVAGEFNITTQIAYADGTQKELESEILIDPEGYVFVQQELGKTSIQNAQVTLWYNVNNEWVVWEAQKYNQQNPQITNDRGEYSFLAPEGKYFLQVTATNYTEYSSTPFNLTQANPIHMPIELKYLGN